MTELDIDLDDTDVEFIPAGAAEDLLEAAERVTAGSGTPPSIPDPVGGKVNLPAGFRRVKTGATGTEFEVVRTAVVRELDGFDEEKIAKADEPGDRAGWLLAVLECGVERLGDKPPTKEDIYALTFGDRDYLLLEIARATYGDDIPYQGFECGHCHETFDVTVSLSEDVPLKTLDSFEETRFEVELRGGRKAKVTLPTCATEPEMEKATTSAERNHIILANSVEVIEGPGSKVIPVQGDFDVVKGLKIRDRRDLLAEIAKRMPGPQYNDVRFKHDPGCGEEVRLRINVPDLFLGM